MTPAWKWLPVVAALALTACGGGGGDDDEEDEDDGPDPLGWTTPPAPPAPPAAGTTITGTFTPYVRGLDYDAGAPLVGTTGADGTFQFAFGGTVTFRVGGVPLGTTQGRVFMTPIQLMAGTNATQTDNRLRFLQMLDADGNPDNGILISEAVRAVAANWAPLDFTLAYADFATAVQPLVDAATQADGVTHTLPADGVARGHFARVFWCAHNGLFRGVYSGGGDDGVWNAVVYGSGQIFGGGYSNVDDEGFGLEKESGNLLLLPTPQFATGQVSTGAVFSGIFPNAYAMTGTWVGVPSGGGTFAGLRSGGSIAPVFRISGYKFPLGTALLMNFEIDANGQVTGSIIDRDFMGTAEPVTLTGTLNGTTITAASTGNQYSLTGTFDPAAAVTALALRGTLRDNVKGRDVNLNSAPLAGCRLN